MTTALLLTDERTSDATAARLAAAFRLGITRQGEVSMSTIAHDDDCPALAGEACACIPDLRIETLGGDVWLDVGRGWTRVAA